MNTAFPHQSQFSWPRCVLLGLAAASLVAVSLPSSADEVRTAIGAGVGAAAGAIVGDSLGGHRGALLGAGVGGVIGARLAQAPIGQPSLHPHAPPAHAPYYARPVEMVPAYPARAFYPLPVYARQAHHHPHHAHRHHHHHQPPATGPWWENGDTPPAHYPHPHGPRHWR